MVMNDGPFPYGRMKVYILLGDSFMGNKLFSDYNTAQQALYNMPMNACFLEYIENTRGGQMRCVYRHYRAHSETCWCAEETDRGMLWELNHDLVELFEYDEYDDVQGIKLRHPSIGLLRDWSDRLPDWFKNNVTRYVSCSNVFSWVQ